MIKWATMTGNDTYYNWLKDIGTKNKWKLYHRPYHTDNHTVGELYLELYENMVIKR